ncbi:MAG: AAA family ATPase [Burkholderiaceae bacterium]|nr:AAA family ATPase [Burkholderiaceae bacterium]
MSDSSSHAGSAVPEAFEAQAHDAAPRPGRWQRARLAARHAGSRVADWFSVQLPVTQVLVVLALLLIPASAIYAWVSMERSTSMAEQVMAMNDTAPGAQPVWALDTSRPVVFGGGSLLSFLASNPVDRVTVIYSPLSWSVSERFVLIESKGTQYAYYPSDMETRIFTEQALTAPWAGKLNFVPRAELQGDAAAMVDRLEKRFSGARPQAGDNWRSGLSAAFSAALTLGLLGFLWFQLRGQIKSLRFIEPAQIKGSIDDLVGMDDIKAEVAQIKDQYQRRAEYAEYGVTKPFNVMFSGPAGTGKTKLASYLAKELKLPILFHSAANLETGFVAGGSQTLNRIVSMAKRRKRCIVFLDEAQDLFMKRGGHRKFDDDTQNMLLAVLDGVRTQGETEIIWIVASNFNQQNQQMDEAMLRRFQMKVDFRTPNREERLAIIEHYLSLRAAKVAPDLDLGHVVAVTEGMSPADIETLVNQAGISAVQAGELIDTETLMLAAERVLVGNTTSATTQERERDRRIIAIHEWGHFLVDLVRERKLADGDWDKLLASMKTLKISLKANPRSNALGFVFHRQGSNLLKTKGDLEHEVRVLLGGMANEELFFGEDGTTNGAHNDITRVTRILHHAVGEMGMYRKTRLNFGALEQGGQSKSVDEETRAVMEAQSERLYAETRALLAPLKPLTEHLAGKLMEAGEMSLTQAIEEIRRFERDCEAFDSQFGSVPPTVAQPA